MKYLTKPQSPAVLVDGRTPKAQWYSLIIPPLAIDR